MPGNNSRNAAVDALKAGEFRNNGRNDVVGVLKANMSLVITYSSVLRRSANERAPGDGL